MLHDYDFVGLLNDIKEKPCPSGFAHKVEGRIVTNKNGRQFCLHRDCVHANMEDVDPHRRFQLLIEEE